MAKYGKKTSKEGEYRQTGTYTYRKRVQGNRNVPQHYKDAQGAYYTWFPKQEAAPKQKAPAPPKPTGNYQSNNLATNTKAVTFDTSAYDAQIKKLSDSLTGLQSQLKANQASYAKSLSDQATNFQSLFSQQQTTFDQNMAAQTDKYDKNMSSLRNSIAETMSSSQQPAVGVKTGAYGKQSAALQRQGVRGSFGRTGLRIKQGIKDKSLNI